MTTESDGNPSGFWLGWLIAGIAIGMLVMVLIGRKGAESKPIRRPIKLIDVDAMLSDMRRRHDADSRNWIEQQKVNAIREQNDLMRRDLYWRQHLDIRRGR